jgi:hypothetical protein
MESDSEELTLSSNLNEGQESQTDQDKSTSQEEGDEEYQTQGQDADKCQDYCSSSEESMDLNEGLAAKERAELLSEGHCFECKQCGLLKGIAQTDEKFPQRIKARE